MQNVTEEPRPVFKVFSIHEQPIREQAGSNGTQDFPGIYRWCSMVLTSPPYCNPYKADKVRVVFVCAARCNGVSPNNLHGRDWYG